MIGKRRSGASVPAVMFAPCAALLFAVMFAFTAALTASAAIIDGDGFTVIDDMSDVSRWSSVTGSTAFISYTDATSYLACGPDDTGYISVRGYGLASGESLEVSRSFDEPLDLFAYDEIGFGINIADADANANANASGVGTDTDAETEDAAAAVTTEYTVTVTLYSTGRTTPYTYSAACGAGEWTLFRVPVGDFSMRTDIVGMSVSVTAQASGGPADNIRLAFRLDSIITTAERDTSIEEKFLAPSFQSRGGVISYGDGCFLLAHSGPGGRIIGYPTIRDRSESDHNVVRFTLSETVDVEAFLEVTYLNGETASTEPQTVPGGELTALYFEIDNAGEIYNFTLRISGEAGELRLYGICLMKRSQTAPSNGVGAFDICRVLSDGSVNIRGTVAPGIVADHMGDNICVYAVPIYADPDEYIADAVPCDSIDMTTRFNVTIPPQELPQGYETMRFVAVIVPSDAANGGSDDGGGTVVAQSFVSFAEDAGAKLPQSPRGIKGFISGRSPVSGSGASVTYINVELSELFGRASSGKLYSFGGDVFYFDNDAVSELDSLIRSPSLTGTSCILRLYDRDGWGISRLMSADNEDDFARVFAAVDYLTSRYSSVDYGFISGIALGESAAFDGRVSGAVTSEESAEAVAMTMAAVYRIGRANIAGFRLILPIGRELASADSGSDSADLLFYLCGESEYIDGVPYELLVEEDGAVALTKCVAGFTSELRGCAPDGLNVIYTSERTVSAESTLADYAEKYYEACEIPGVNGFTLSLDADSLSAYDRDRFIKNFFLLDTSEHVDAEEFAGITATGGEAAHPVRIFVGYAMNVLSTAVGSYDIFDFTDSFSTSGWFSFSGAGECATMRASGGRILRADASSGGMVYSCADRPLDISAAPFVRLEAHGSEDGIYELTVYSALGIYRTEFTLKSTHSSYYFDLSDFVGKSGITGMSVTSASGKGELYVSRISLFSLELDDDALKERFAADLSDEDSAAGEENMVEIMAVSLTALALGAATVAIFGFMARGSSEDKVREHDRDEKKDKDKDKERGAVL